MTKRDFYILFFLTLFIWNSGVEIQDFSFLSHLDYWFIGVCVFGLVWLIWYLDKLVFNFIQKRFKLNFQKLRTFTPYYILSYHISAAVYVVGFNFLFALPSPSNINTAFSLNAGSILFTSFLLTSFFLYLKIKNELEEKPKEIIRKEIVQKVIIQEVEAPSPKLQLQRGNYAFQIAVEEIGYFSLNNSIVYLTQTNGTVFPIMDTLAQIKSQCKNGELFAANRQFLVTKKAVQSWKRTETRKLALKLSPKTSELVTVSKNKAPEFIKWIEN